MVGDENGSGLIGTTGAAAARPARSRPIGTGPAEEPAYPHGRGHAAACLAPPWTCRFHAAENTCSAQCRPSRPVRREPNRSTPRAGVGDSRADGRCRGANDRSALGHLHQVRPGRIRHSSFRSPPGGRATSRSSSSPPLRRRRKPAEPPRLMFANVDRAPVGRRRSADEAAVVLPEQEHVARRTPGRRHAPRIDVGAVARAVRRTHFGSEAANAPHPGSDRVEGSATRASAGVKAPAAASAPRKPPRVDGMKRRDDGGVASPAESRRRRWRPGHFQRSVSPRPTANTRGRACRPGSARAPERSAPTPSASRRRQA